jgi:hypothetical protein
LKIVGEAARLAFRRHSAQLFRGTKPIFFGRSFGTATLLPEGMSQRRDFIMSEGYGAMYSHGLSHLVRPFRMLEGLPGMLVARLMFRFPLLFTGAMGVGSEVVQLGGPLMIFVMGSVVISCGHIAST